MDSSTEGPAGRENGDDERPRAGLLLASLVDAGPDERRRIEQRLVDEVFELTVRRVCAKFGKLSRADAEELVSSALTELLEKPDRYDPSRSSLAGFLFMVVSRDAMNRLDREARRPSLLRLSDIPALSRAEFPDRADSSDDSGETPGNQSDRLRAALSELPPRPREVLLHHAEGLTNPEIADLLDCSQPAVRVALHRGRKRLREELIRNGVRNDGDGEGEVTEDEA